MCRIVPHWGTRMLLPLFITCDNGCPCCVGAAVTPFAMTDLDSSVPGRIPNKTAAAFLLRELLK